ncbi:MAG: hypothetical protein M1820_010291 [Bogoriella megaspora]|nr:MAG: hypothetical protein M1820_010291 [Bogoriella megaspora]
MPVQSSEEWLAQEREWIAKFFEKLVPEVLGERSQLCGMKDCHEFASRILRTQDIQPVENQGSTSYTLACPSQSSIVQFRLKRFDEEILALAHKIYGDVVPAITFFDGFPLPVYVGGIIPGQLHMFQKFPSDNFPLERQLTTVTELGQFVAKSAYWPQPTSSYSPTSCTKSARNTLLRLSENDALKKIEPRYSEKAIALLTKVHLLDKLPPVLSHPDFAEVNIFVDSEGHVTGVIDFEDAQTEAFGMCIFGVYEGFFGVMNNQKWTFFDQPARDRYGPRTSVRNVLETKFWESLWDAMPPTMGKQELSEAVMVALEVGIINRYLVRGLLDGVDFESEDHRIDLEWARGLFLER